MKPRVSVIMPVLNGESYIGEAIRSILDQTYRDAELIVVNDGSTDSTGTIIEGFADKIALKHIVHSERQGIPPSMNDGVRHASGDFIAFLDHDDAWLPTFLETQVAYLDAHPEVGMVHSDFQTIDSQGNVIEYSVARCRNRTRPSGQVFRQLFLDSFVVGNSVLIRRECFDQLGLFDEGLRWGDYHMWLRIALRYRVDFVDQVLTKYRQHSSQSTRTIDPNEPVQDSVGLQTLRKLLDSFPEVLDQLGQRAINERMATLYFDMAYIWWSGDAFVNARSCLHKAIRLAPFNFRYYVLYAAALLSPSLSRSLQGWWRRLRNVLTFEAHPTEPTSDGSGRT